MDMMFVFVAFGMNSALLAWRVNVQTPLLLSNPHIIKPPILSTPSYYRGFNNDVLFSFDFLYLLTG